MRKTLLLLLLFCASSMMVVAQRTVSGKVVDESGEALLGVTVLVQGTSTGVTTDIDGNYRISVQDGSVLVFSYVGFETVELTVGNRTTIDITMSGVTELQEVVVTGSAVGKSKETLSFAVGSIDEKLITEVPTTNLGAGLQGKVAGLRVTSVGGQPGSGVSFQARGANSLTTGQNPLIIVDGAFLNGGTLADINPEDIEKIEVLKGSAGASLYGSQAANGVIQIFTKRGSKLSEGETVVTYRGEYGVSELANGFFPVATTHPFQLDGSGNFIFDATGSRVLEDDQIADNPWPNFQNYQDQIFRNGEFNSNYVSVQGRSSTTNFMLSAQRVNDEGVIETIEGYTRNSFKLNVDHRLSDKMDVNTSFGYSNSTQDRLPENGTNALINNILFYPPFYDLSSPNEEDGSLYDWDIDSLGSTIRNPLYTLNNRETTQERNRVIGTIRANYDVNDWLSLNGSASVDRSVNEFEEFINKGYLSDDIRQGVQFDPSDPSQGPGGGIEKSTNVRQSVISRLNAIITRTFNDFDVALRLSYLYEDLTTDFNSVRGDDLAVSGIRSLDNITDVSTLRIQSFAEQVVANSFFAIADVDYQKKYIFSGLVRREGSSLFGPDERWATYYRASAAYRISEDFTIPGFQELKARISYGTAGIRPSFQQRFETFALRNGTASPATFGNDLLRPARSGELEVGLDARFLDRFSLEFNYAKTTTEDQILRINLPGAAGFSAQWRNAGTVEATTYEVALGAEILNTNGFQWNVSFNFDRSRQKITQLDVPPYLTGPGNQQSTIFRIEEGVAFGAMYGQVFATSVDQIQSMADAQVVDPNTGSVYDASGFEINEFGYVVSSAARGTVNEVPIKLIDPTGAPIVQKIGDINPDFRVGIVNNFSWKNVSLYTLFDWKQGGDIYNQSRTWLFRDQIHEDVGNFNLPVSFWNGLYNVNVPNNSAVEDGSFFMLRELGLSYTFTSSQLSGIFGDLMRSVKIGFVGRNLFTITDYTGYHPDITSAPENENQLTNRLQDGVGSNANNPGGDPNVFYFDSFSYPRTKSYSASIQITF